MNQYTIDTKIYEEAEIIWKSLKGKTVKEINQIIFLLKEKIETTCQAV